MLQASVSVPEPPHSVPPFAAGISSVIVRVLVPSPHVAEQADHSPYWPHTQSTTYEHDVQKIKVYYMSIKHIWQLRKKEYGRSKCYK